MSCENRKIVLAFSSMIALVVTAIIVFDFSLYIKAFLGTVILGLLCFMRSLMNAVEIPEDVEDEDVQVAEPVSGDDDESFQHFLEEHEKKKEEGSSCEFSVTSDEFIKHFEELAKSNKKH